MQEPKWLNLKEVSDCIFNKTALRFSVARLRYWTNPLHGKRAPSGRKVLLPSVRRFGRIYVWSEWVAKFIEEANN